MKLLSLFTAMALTAMITFSAGAQTLDLTKDSTPKTSARYDSLIKVSAPAEDAFVAVQRVAAPYIRARQWVKAIEIFERYRPLFNNMDDRFANIVSLLEADEEGLVVKNLGPNINTSAGEWDPTPTTDGRFLYFTGYGRADCLGRSDVFLSEFDNGEWQPATNLGSDVNTKEGSETMNNITADGNRLLLSGTVAGLFKMFYVDKTMAGWGPPHVFPKPINSPYHDDGPLITSDGKAILFESDRPGGTGDYHRRGISFHGDRWGSTDLYVCVKNDSGWSAPINLGSTINTPYAETAHFLHPDGKTLYFSSNGHYGLGRLDVFKSVRQREDSWTEWSEPVNLGKEINTVDDEWGYKVTTSGEVAYFAARNRKDGYGGWDTYSVTLPKEAKPEVVVTIRGKVIDRAGNPLAADIKWEDLATGQNVGELKSDPQNGSYFIPLTLGINYGYYAEVPGYYPVSSSVNLQNSTQSHDITEDIVLVAIEELKQKDTTVRINNIFFDFDQYDLRPESFPELRRLGKILQENPELQVEIAGHTDNVGPEAHNLWLSNNRALAVVDYLVSLGCDHTKLIALGHGEGKPIAATTPKKVG